MEVARAEEAGPGREAIAVVNGFPVATDRLYHAATHMWVAITGDIARIGLDALGIETSGALAQLSVLAPGAQVTAGRPFGQLEAAKFVGPLVSPVSGTLVAVNEPVLAQPDSARSGLLAGHDEIIRWFAAAVDGYRARGVLAE
jgi:glycine cleavage system H protein